MPWLLSFPSGWRHSWSGRGSQANLDLKEGWITAGQTFISTLYLSSLAICLHRRTLFGAWDTIKLIKLPTRFLIHNCTVFFVSYQLTQVPSNVSLILFWSNSLRNLDPSQFQLYFRLTSTSPILCVTLLPSKSLLSSFNHSLNQPMGLWNKFIHEFVLKKRDTEREGERIFPLAVAAAWVLGWWEADNTEETRDFLETSFYLVIKYQLSGVDEGRCVLSTAPSKTQMLSTPGCWDMAGQCRLPPHSETGSLEEGSQDIIFLPLCLPPSKDTEFLPSEEAAPTRLNS